MPVTDSEGVKVGSRWGFYFIAIGFLFSFQGFINDVFASNFWIPFITLEVFLFALFFAATLHMRGYMYLGSEYDSRLLTYTALASSAFFLTFGLLLISSTFFSVFKGIHVFDSILGALLYVQFVLGGLFLFVVGRLRTRTGMFAFAPVLFSFWIFFMWHGWPLVLLGAPSAIFLFKESSGG